jgi:quinol monooxygenase YgiN
MIIVIGSVLAKKETFDELLELSLEHSRRSRTEPGCLAHRLHRDCENPMLLTFVEEWTAPAALAAHFKVPASRAFVKAAQAMAAGPPKMNVYEACPHKIQ